MSGRGDRPPADTHAVLAVPALLSVQTAAQLLECSPRTIRRRIAAGLLPAVLEQERTMIRGDDLRAYIDALPHAGPARHRRRNARPRARSFDFLRETP